MTAGKSSRINRQYKTKYRIRNWREYERGLRSRGDVTIWLSEDAIAVWIPPKNGLRGGQRRYSNLAIRTALTLRVVFGLPLRQTALGNTNRCAFISPLKRARMMRPSSVSNAARAARSIAVRMSCAGTNARRPRCRTTSRLWLERAVRCRRASLGPDGAAVRCGAPARCGSPGAGAYRSNQDHHRPEDSCAPAKRCRRESRVALRAPMPVQDVVKPLARPKNDGSGFETA